MRDAASGVCAMLAASTVWGLSPLYYKLLVHVPPLELLAHRTLWSFFFFAGVLALQGRLGHLRHALGAPGGARELALAAFLISANWFLFISAIQFDRAMEASLGYYIFPLVSVLLGALAFGERLSPAQCLSVALAGLAVAALTAGVGVMPWIAILIAMSFGLYGLVKKKLSVGPVVSVTSEVLLLSPVALAILIWFHTGDGARFGAGLGDSLLLMLSGPLTAIPLILFSYATKRVALTTIGLVQYLNPTLQFLVATFIFLEPLTVWNGFAFLLIWTALALFTVSSLRQDRAARRAAGM